MQQVHRGDIFYADLSPVVGSEQGGVRPVLVIQNEMGEQTQPDRDMCGYYFENAQVETSDACGD